MTKSSGGSAAVKRQFDRAAADAVPLLRVGIVSDIQALPFPGDWGMHNLDRAFFMLAPKRLDVLVMAGDLADGAAPEVFAAWRELAAERFGSPGPALVACAGNHDYWVSGRFEDRDHRKLYEIFCRGIGQSPEDPFHTAVKGYHFIALSEDVNEGQYSPAAVAALEAEICKAVAAAPDKPVFVITHYPPFDTVCGSHCKSAQRQLGEMLKKYPQAVSFSGHTHYPLEDDRGLWQGEYTAVTTSTLAYACMEERPYNSCNSIVPFAREATQMLYMEVFADRLVIRRYNVTDRREIKPDRPWTVELPHDPARAARIDRSAGRKAPEFPAGAELLVRYDYGFSYLIFDAAEHDDMVQFYRLKIVDAVSGETVFDRRYVSDFYRLERNRDPRQVIRLPGEALKPGHEYRYELYPVETFGKEGAPLCLTARVPDSYVFRTDVRIYPQE